MHACAMQQLVQEHAMVIGREIIIGTNDGVQIRLHELKHNVQVLEAARVLGQHDVLDLNHVWWGG